MSVLFALVDKNKSTEKITCLEFFSGIGGFHFAMKDVTDRLQVLGAFDINTAANAIYKHNFPNTKVYSNNIQSLSAERLDSFNADLWTLSPPCQPFTKRGNCLGGEDPRSDALQHLVEMLKVVKDPPRFILLENVPEFKNSDAEKSLLEVLDKRSYRYERILQSSISYGIPNARKRYYLLATLWTEERNLGRRISRCYVPSEKVKPLRTYLSEEADEDKSLFISTEKLLRYKDVLDLVVPRAVKSTCFTKAYRHYLKGSGSLIVSKAPRGFTKAKFLEMAVERPNELSALGIRYFSVKEISALLGFKNLKCPPGTTEAQMVRGLGNSINVHVVTSLLDHLLFHYEQVLSPPQNTAS